MFNSIHDYTKRRGFLKVVIKKRKKMGYTNPNLDCI